VSWRATTCASNNKNEKFNEDDHDKSKSTTSKNPNLQTGGVTAEVASVGGRQRGTLETGSVGAHPERMETAKSNTMKENRTERKRELD
jgi:hypothetical protein